MSFPLINISLKFTTITQILVHVLAARSSRMPAHWFFLLYLISKNTNSALQNIDFTIGALSFGQLNFCHNLIDFHVMATKL